MIVDGFLGALIDSRVDSRIFSGFILARIAPCMHLICNQKGLICGFYGKLLLIGKNTKAQYQIPLLSCRSLYLSWNLKIMLFCTALHYFQWLLVCKKGYVPVFFQRIICCRLCPGQGHMLPGLFWRFLTATMTKQPATTKIETSIVYYIPQRSFM